MDNINELIREGEAYLKEGVFVKRTVRLKCKCGGEYQFDIKDYKGRHLHHCTKCMNTLALDTRYPTIAITEE